MADERLSRDASPVPDYGALVGLNGKAFIVVGAGSGMGRQSAHALAQLGAQVLCVDVDADAAHAVAEEVNGVAAVADPTETEGAVDAVGRAQANFGRLDGVVDIVGMARWAPIVDMPEDDWDWCQRMNLRHVFLLIKHAAPAIAEVGGGSLTFVSSISSLWVAPFHAAYGAAKAGLNSLIRTAAWELRPKNVRVNAIAPAETATPRLAASRSMPAEQLADGSLMGMAATSDIAAAILFAASDLGRHVSGQVITVDAGAGYRSIAALDAPILPPGTHMGQDG